MISNICNQAEGQGILVVVRDAGWEVVVANWKCEAGDGSGLGGPLPRGLGVDLYKAVVSCRE